ncbi:hypothetical protein WA026_004084 [Henosepilachna vigintioctopunctata]
MREYFFNIPMYSIFERADIEKVMKAPSKYPVRPPTAAIVAYRYSRPDRYSSAGVVNEQGEKWHNLRLSLTSELTSPKTIANFHAEVKNLARDWCREIKSAKCHSGAVDNIANLLLPLCIETSCALILGRRLGFMCPEKLPMKFQKLGEAIKNYFICLRDTQHASPLWKYFGSASYRKMMKCEDQIYDTVLNIINESNGENNIGTVYSSIINSNIDEKEKIAAIIDFIMAGIQTLKNSLIFLLYLVAKNSSVQRKIIENPGYAKACMKESFRLLPTATPLARILEQDMKLAGYQIKSGSVVLCHNGIACRNEENFDFPLSFIPERWLGENVHKTSTIGTFIVIPFGSGKRICPGKRFIELVLPIFLKKIVTNFKIVTDDVLDLQHEFLLSAKEPLSMFFHDR